MKIYIQIFNFLKKYQPYSVYLLVAIFLLSSFIEAIGISFVMPVIALVLDENFLQILRNSSFEKYVPEFILSMERTDALMFFSVFIIIIYFVKNIILIITEYLKSIFINKVKEKITTVMMNKYLHQDYLYHSKKDNSEINSTLNQKINDLTDGLMSSILFILSELIMILGLIGLIIFFNQVKTFLILIVLFIIGVISAKIISTFIKKIGSKRQQSVNVKFENFTNIINNLREIILTGKSDIYFAKFSSSLKVIAKMDAVRAALQRSPQLIFETLGVTGLVLIIYYLLNINASSVKIVATCTFFAAVCYRAIPSLHKLLFYYYNVKYYNPVFNELINEIDIQNKIEYHNEKFQIKKNINLENIFFKYDENSISTIKNLNLEIKFNSSIGIFGKSGSGKTTFLDILSGLVVPNSGSLFVDDQIINDNFLRRKLQNNISYISQKTTVINDTLLKNVCFGIEEKNIDYQKYNEVLEICELKDIEKNFDNKLKKVVDFGKNISGGQLQRIGIARALYQDKEILIFDEATNALDEYLEKKIVSNLTHLKKGKLLIFVSHNQQLLNNFDNVYEFKNSNIIKIK
jgi:ABC-type bacteriocin/lantibiotic exporter with double-glycine peptidase domain